MHLGVIAFSTDRSLGPAEVARAAEDRGFESVWFPEHSHMPLASGGWPGGPQIPEIYARTVDLFVALSAAAGATSRIRLGTGICLVAQHHPIWLAKQIASVDFLSSGRLVLGVGFGWNRAEMAHHGVDFACRREITAEHIAAMRALWTEEVASFDGRFVQFGPSRAWPKPVQAGGPPVILGAGAGPKLRHAVATYAQGWAPMNGRNPVAAEIQGVRQAVAAAGRNPDELDITLFAAPTDPAQLEELQQLGITRAVFGVPSAGADKVFPALDRLARLLG